MALPDIGAVIAPFLERVPPEEQPLFVALAERMAAERYRRWAALATDAEGRKALLACADREEEIASAVEALTPDAGTVQRALLETNPSLPEINSNLFEGRPLADQWMIQARGERLGAATWRAFAGRDEGAQREVFERCARLEEASAEVLEALLDGKPTGAAPGR